jgi:hypothetical protein
MLDIPYMNRHGRIMEMTTHQVSVAAEAFAACLFAQAGCDVLIQYGANQPDYDFVAMRKSKAARISVKGTQWAGWGLIQNYKKGRSYHEASTAWFRDQPKDVVFCLVTFGKVTGYDFPRCYLARAREIAKHHNSARGGAGHTTLYEDSTPTKGIGKGHRYKIPDEWKFSLKRVNEILRA